MFQRNELRESGGIGRRARLRGVCLRRTGSSPVSRTRKRIPISESSFILSVNADMAELADALDSGSNECKFVQVQVLLSAPKNGVRNSVLRFFGANK